MVNNIRGAQQIIDWLAKFAEWRRLGRAFLEGCGGFFLGVGWTLVADYAFFIFLNRIFFPGEVDSAGLMVVTEIGFFYLPVVAGVLFFIVRFIRGWRYAIPTDKPIRGLVIEPNAMAYAEPEGVPDGAIEQVSAPQENLPVSAVLKRKSFVFKFAFGLIQIIWFVTAFWLIQEGWSYITAQTYPGPKMSRTDRKLFLVIGTRPIAPKRIDQELRLFDLDEWQLTLEREPAWSLRLPVGEGKVKNKYDELSAQFRVEEINVHTQQITVDGKDNDHTMTVKYEQVNGYTLHPMYLRTKGPEQWAAGLIGAFLTSLLLWKLAVPLVLRKLGLASASYPDPEVVLPSTSNPDPKVVLPMATCSACRHEISKDQQTCPHCGAKRYSLVIRLLVNFLLLPGILLGSCSLVAIGMNHLPSAESGLALSDEIPPPGRFPLIAVIPSEIKPGTSDVTSFVWYRWQIWKRDHPTIRFSFLLPQEKGVVDRTFACDALAGYQTYPDCREQGTYRVTQLSPQRQLVEITLLRSVVGAPDQYAHSYRSRYEAEEHTIHPKYFDGPPRQTSSDSLMWRLLAYFLVPLAAVLVVNWRLPKGLGLQVGSTRDFISLFALLAGIGLMAIIAVPNFQIHQMRARQSEARTILHAIHEAEAAFYEKHHRYGTFDEIGFVVPNERWMRYTYRLDGSDKPGLILGPTHSLATPNNTIVLPGFSATGFTATATGNIDNDSTIDQWHINDVKQGLGKADVNDVTN